MCGQAFIGSSFIPQPSGGGGSGGGGGGAAVTKIIYTATGGETDFNVPIPGGAVTDTSYAIAIGLAQVTFQVEINMPTTGRTTAHFQVLAGAPLTAGDVINFLVAA